MALAAPIANTQGQHKFLLRLSCWPPTSRNVCWCPLWVRRGHSATS